MGDEGGRTVVADLGEPPKYTADGHPVGRPPTCEHKFRWGECPRCDHLKPPPDDFREWVRQAKETK